MTFGDNTMIAEGLRDFITDLGKTFCLHVSKETAKNVTKNISRALDITANVASSLSSRNPENVLSTLPELIKTVHTGREVYLEKTV